MLYAALVVQPAPSQNPHPKPRFAIFLECKIQRALGVGAKKQPRKWTGWNALIYLLDTINGRIPH